MLKCTAIEVDYDRYNTRYLMAKRLTTFKEYIGQLAKSRKGMVALCIVCLLEPIILPIYPEFVLAPVLLTRPNQQLKIFFTAILCTLLGSAVAYTLGYTLGNIALNQLSTEKLTYFFNIKSYLNTYGLLIPFVGSFLPLPLKMITWTCGLTHFNAVLFGGAIFAGRSLRYSLLLLFSIRKKKHKSPQIIADLDPAP